MNRRGYLGPAGTSVKDSGLGFDAFTRPGSFHLRLRF